MTIADIKQRPKKMKTLDSTWLDMIHTYWLNGKVQERLET